MRNSTNETLIDFNMGQGQLSKGTQRTVAGTEIVNRKQDAHFVQFLERRGVAAESDVLGDLKF